MSRLLRTLKKLQGERLSIKDHIYEFFYCNFGPVRALKNNINCGIRNIFTFGKVIWNYRWWDHSFMYGVLIKILEDMAQKHLLYSHTITKSRDNKIKKMKIMSHCLRRIQEDSYNYEEWVGLYEKYPLKLLGKRITHSKQEMIDKRRHYNKCEELKKGDWELFLKYMRQSEEFWD